MSDAGFLHSIVFYQCLMEKNMLGRPTARQEHTAKLRLPTVEGKRNYSEFARLRFYLHCGSKRLLKKRRVLR